MRAALFWPMVAFVLAAACWSGPLGPDTVTAPAVPRDALLVCPYDFPPLSLERVRAQFLALHELSELNYRGEGVWTVRKNYAPPSARTTSRRVLAYLGGRRVFPDRPVFSDRARQGLERLLRIQRPDGSIPWLGYSFDGVVNDAGVLFEGGIAGVAFLEGWLAFGDSRYLAASAGLAEWEMSYPVTDNVNYDLFAVWHLAAHYEATGESAYLEGAVEKCRSAAFAGQLPYGGWPGHNAYVWYHAIIVRGMARLYGALPERHPFRGELRPVLVAATNRLIRSQLPSGRCRALPEPEPLDEDSGVYTGQAVLLAESALGEPGLRRVLDGILEGRRVEDAEGLARIRGKVEEYAAFEPESEPAFEPVERVVSGCEGFAAADDAAGEVVTGGRVAWVEGYAPSDAVAYLRDARQPRSGDLCQAVRVAGPTERVELCGVGLRLAASLFESNRRYSLRAWAESDGAAGRQRIVYIAVSAAAKAEPWNVMDGSAWMMEDSVPGAYRLLRVDIDVAEPDERILYLWQVTDPLCAGEEVVVRFDDVHLVDMGPLAAVRPPKLPGWERDFMFYGMLLRALEEAGGTVEPARP